MNNKSQIYQWHYFLETKITHLIGLAVIKLKFPQTKLIIDEREISLKWATKGGSIA